MVAISSSLLLEKRQLRQKTKKKWSLFLLLKMAPKKVSLHYCTLRRVSSNSASPVEAARCNKGSIPRQHWAESVVPTLYAGKDADFSIIFLETLFSSPSTHSSLAPSFSLFEISFLRLDSSRQRSGNYGHVLLVRRLGEEAASAAATRTTVLSSLVVELSGKPRPPRPPSRRLRWASSASCSSSWSSSYETHRSTLRNSSASCR